MPSSPPAYNFLKFVFDKIITFWPLSWPQCTWLLALLSDNSLVLLMHIQRKQKRENNEILLSAVWLHFIMLILLQLWNCTFRSQCFSHDYIFRTFPSKTSPPTNSTPTPTSPHSLISHHLPFSDYLPAFCLVSNFSVLLLPIWSLHFV